MRGLVVGVVLGIGIALAGTAAAHELTARAPSCRANSTGYVCSFPHIPKGRYTAYTLKVPDVDLSCLFSRYNRASFDCDRLSKPTLKCVDDTLSSLSVSITLGKMEVDTPQHCIPEPGHHPPYKLTSGYRAHTFYRAP